MKIKCAVFALILLLGLSLCTLAAEAADLPSAAQHVFDGSGLLTSEEWEKLESRAETLSQSHRCGIYFATVDDYTEYGDGDVFETTYQIYHDNQLGVGEGRDGIIVLLSMKERDYAMFVYGPYAEQVFDEDGLEKLEDAFLGDFGRDDWYGGISHYLDACDRYLTQAEEGGPVRSPKWIWIVVVTATSCLIAGIVCLLLKRNMKTVRQKAEANAYITAGGLHLTKQYDLYTHTTHVRTKVQNHSSSSRSGGGGRGRSGKF